jgi:hypothetical protein
MRLCDWIKQRNTAVTHLSDGRVTIKERIIIFCHVCRKAAGLRETALIFGRGLAIFSRSFHAVLLALVQLHKEIVYQQDPAVDYPAHPRLRNDPKMWPYFKDCIGAVDGFHIHAHIPYSEQGPWRNRKGFIS